MDQRILGASYKMPPGSARTVGQRLAMPPVVVNPRVQRLTTPLPMRAVDLGARPPPIAGFDVASAPRSITPTSQFRGSGAYPQAMIFAGKYPANQATRSVSQPPLRSAPPASPSSLSSTARRVQLVATVATVNAPITVSSTQRIQELLSDRKELKSIVIESFRAAVAATGNKGLDIVRLRRFREALTESSRIHGSILNGIEDASTQFDFRGNGQLELNSVYKLVKFHLREWLKRHGGEASGTVNIPTKSLTQAGYSVIKKLGEGSQAQAMLATNRAGQQVCVKTYRKPIAVAGIEELKDEFEALQLLSCERVARAFEIFQDAQCYYMVNEALMGGDFTTLQQRARGQGVAMSEDWWRDIFRQCVEALTFMHDQAVMHCDVKEANMMLRTSDFHHPEVVIIDFGVSKAMAPGGKAEVGICGTPGYIPPETWDRQRWFPKGDVFSLGVCVIQLMTNKLPPTGPRLLTTPGGIFIEGCGAPQDIAQATRTRQPPFHLLAPLPELNRVCQRLLQKHMKHRPTAAQTLQDPWFAAKRAGSKAFDRQLSFDRETTPRSSLVMKLNPRNRFATMGITDDYLLEHDEQANATKCEAIQIACENSRSSRNPSKCEAIKEDGAGLNSFEAKLDRACEPFFSSSRPVETALVERPVQRARTMPVFNHAVQSTTTGGTLATVVQIMATKMPENVSESVSTAIAVSSIGSGANASVSSSGRFEKVGMETATSTITPTPKSPRLKSSPRIYLKSASPPPRSGFAAAYRTGVPTSIHVGSPGGVVMAAQSPLSSPVAISGRQVVVVSPQPSSHYAYRQTLPHTRVNVYS